VTAVCNSIEQGLNQSSHWRLARGVDHPLDPPPSIPHQRFQVVPRLGIRRVQLQNALERRFEDFGSRAIGQAYMQEREVYFFRSMVMARFTGVSTS
jgi:hypothetical protein